VDIRVVSPTAWAEATDPFVRTVKERPLATLQLSGTGWHRRSASR